MAQLASAPHTIATPQSGNIGGIIARPFEPLGRIESKRATSSRLSMPIIPHMRASHFALKRIDLSPSAQTSLSHQGGGDGFNWANARLETRNNYVTNWLPAAFRLERRPARPLRTTAFGTETHTHQCCTEGTRGAAGTIPNISMPYRAMLPRRPSRPAFHRERPTAHDATTLPRNRDVTMGIIGELHDGH
jgi:hypothetical protein